jgi:prepilin-type N-terminal cleavage/methylation domain-containing protein
MNLEHGGDEAAAPRTGDRHPARGADTQAMNAGSALRRLARLRRLVAGEGGFTLVEMIMAMVILVIVITSLTAVLVDSSKAELDADRRFHAQEEARLVLDKARRELHCAQAVTVVDHGAAVGAGVSGNGVYATLNGYCPTSGLPNPTDTLYVTWCTSASSLESGDYALYRLTSQASQPACATTGVKWADYLTTRTPFCLPDTSNACGGVLKNGTSLPTLHVTLPVNLNGPSSAVDDYTLVDDIALRNLLRS